MSVFLSLLSQKLVDYYYKSGLLNNDILIEW